MRNFFYLEGAYIILAFIILAITLFITTRPFMSKDAPKKGLSIVGLFLALFIGAHYYITTQRIKQVKKAFLEGKPILCENRLYTKGAQFVTIKKDFGFLLKGDFFSSPSYTRPFFAARCIVEK